MDPSKNQETGVSASPSPDISAEQREILNNALLVDQSGEIAANWIYRGQVTVIGHDPRVGPLIQVNHLETAIQPLSIGLIWQRKCETRRNNIRKSWINLNYSYK
jgi:demethoxyubiquinone hydroxylase (CLK1/Coq7/Cat5 family)